MARLSQSAVVIRFVLGKGLVKARQRYDDTARAIFRRVTLEYAEGAYEEMRKNLQATVEADVRAELVHMALLFRRHIIGAAGTKTTPSGGLDTVTKGSGAPRQTLSSMLPAWAPRNAEYLQRKRTATGGVGWFDNRGWKESQYDARYSSRVSRKPGRAAMHGLLFREMRQDTWETMFGPISVRFYRQRKLESTDGVANLGVAKKKNMQVQIGSIQVRALGRITPAMLPGFTSGDVRASVAGNPELIKLVYGYDPQLALRLGQMNNGVYRPTLEPFLGFFLTRSLPYAVNERLRKGVLKTAFRSS